VIASLRGKLHSLRENSAVVDVGGMGFLVYMPTPTLSKLGGAGSEVFLFTHFYLREDGAAIYGFTDEEELGLFRRLLFVSGLGPRLALSMLSAMDVRQLAAAIASGNTALLTQIPGIGRKMAERLVVELKDKVAAEWVEASAAEAVEGNADVLAALTSLGYSAAEATRAVAGLPVEAAKLELQERLRLALAYFTPE